MNPAHTLGLLLALHAVSGRAALASPKHSPSTPQSSQDTGMDTGMDTGLDTELVETPELSVPPPEGVGPSPSLPEFVADEALTDRIRFLRGDSDGDGQVTISDAVSVLQFLFAGMPLSENQPCLDASDVNDDGRIDVSDAISLLDHLFTGTATPAEPYPEPGFDPGGAGDHLTEVCSLPVTDSLESSTSTCECDWDVTLHTTYEKKNAQVRDTQHHLHWTYDGMSLENASYSGGTFDRFHFLDAWGNWAYQYGRLSIERINGYNSAPERQETGIRDLQENGLEIEHYTQAVTELQLVNTNGCTEGNCSWPAGDSRVDAQLWFKAGGQNEWGLFSQDEFHATAASELIWRGGNSLSGHASHAVSVASDDSNISEISVPVFKTYVPVQLLAAEQYDRQVVYAHRDFSTLTDRGTRYGLKLDLKTALDLGLEPSSFHGAAHTYARAEPRIYADVSGGCENCGIKTYVRDRSAFVEVTRCGETELQCYRAGSNAFSAEETPAHEIQGLTVPWKRVDCQEDELPDSLAPQTVQASQAQLSPKVETAQRELAQALGVSPARRSQSAIILDPQVGDLLAGLGGSPAPCWDGTLTQWALLSTTAQETLWETCTELETHLVQWKPGDSETLLPLGVQVAR